ERLCSIWEEMDANRSTKIGLGLLLNHPIIEDMVANCCKYRAPDFKQILNQKNDDGDSHGHQTPEQTTFA
ncbi:unnamed protein product, partial [Didymodactylos carnosus]